MHKNATYTCYLKLIRAGCVQSSALRFDASVKASSPMLDFRVNHSLESLVKFVPCRHNALAQ